MLHSCWHRAGFTLIETLVVITIIGAIMGMLMPAVQSARESGRRIQCGNNLRQLGLAAQHHQAVLGFFPSGGWGHSWVGDPDRSPGSRQPGGWVYAVLPYIEQDPIYRQGTGGKSADKRAAADQLVQHPIPLFACPTRRTATLSPYDESRPPYNGSMVLRVAKSDYAINAGDNDPGVKRMPISLEEGDRDDFPWPDFSTATGISFFRSQIDIARVKDGTSQTYLIGEKYCRLPGAGYDAGDDESMYVGYDYDTTRWCKPSSSPRGDAEPDQRDIFGSAHVQACLFVMCDGSVRSINYGIDPDIHRRLGNRRDGQVIDASRF